MKSLIPLLAGGVLVVGIIGGVLILKDKPLESSAESIQQEQIKQKKTVTGSAESTVSIVTKTPDNGVPLPTEEDIIRTFVNLIDEGKSSDAVNMMSKAITGDANSKQAWAVQFNAFESAKLTSVEASNRTNPPIGEASWTDMTHRYKVTLNAEMKPESADEVIPYFGWDNGENIRWVELIKEDEKWKVNGIATGA